jgi:pyruvate kinase
MRQTKIVATIGPATDSPTSISDLVAAGVDVFRLNFSHGTRDGHRAVIERIREASQQAQRHVAILQDLGGPKIRTGRMTDGQPLMLQPGQELRIVTGNALGVQGCISTTYPALATSVTPGDTLLIDDGRIELRVLSTDGAEIVTQVVNGGPLSDHKGINAPGVKLPASALTEKDVDDLQFGLALHVDLVALSFVQTADDLHAARRVMTDANTLVPLIAKIERPAAVENIAEILDACDAVMVARGDLGLEVPLETVPGIQKEITRRARVKGIPVILATQVLDSMRTEPRPTRAEVSDAASAVGDSVDAIMLSGETAVGAFPLRTVRTLDAIIREAEHLPPDVAPHMELTPIVPAKHVYGLALCQAAVTLAVHADAGAIVAVTKAGQTARMLSALRPSMPIFAASTDPAVARRLSLYRGVTPLTTEWGPNADAVSFLLEQQLCEREMVRAGAVLVFVNIDLDLTRIDANFLGLRRSSGGTVKK